MKNVGDLAALDEDGRHLGNTVAAEGADASGFDIDNDERDLGEWRAEQILLHDRGGRVAHVGNLVPGSNVPTVLFPLTRITCEIIHKPSRDSETRR